MPSQAASGHANADAPRAVRFGVFEFDSRRRELRKHGVKLKLQGKPFQVLQALLERPGELVTREELRQRLWPSDVFVDFEQGLNTAANRLRIALGDSAENPRYIETLARAGYRFIAPVQVLDVPVPPTVEVSGAPEPTQPSAGQPSAGFASPVQPSLTQPSTLSGPQPSTQRGWRAVGGKVLLLTVATAALLVGVVAIWLEVSQPSPADFHFRPVTFRRGQIGGARFAQDGHSVLYTAIWDNGRRQLFQTQPSSPESRPLGFDGLGLAAVSHAGELALLSTDGTMPIRGGLLSRAPLNGGAPRPIERNVMSADWSADGRLAIVRAIQGVNQLEFPAGTVLYKTAGWISNLRIAPQDDRVAFVEHPVRNDDLGSVKLFEPGNGVRQLSGEWPAAGGLAWHPSGREVWFTAARDGSPKSLWAVTLSGRLRSVTQIAGTMTLRDIAPDGRLLTSRDTQLLEMIARVIDETGHAPDRNVTWLDWSRVADISDDGTLILFDESGVGAGPQYRVYVHRLDDESTVHLGEGRAMGLSPDGRFALVLGTQERQHLRLLPLAGGKATELPATGLDYQWVRYFPDGQRLIALANESGRPLRLYVQPLTGKPFPVTPPTVARNVAISPDGTRVAVLGADGKLAVYPTSALDARKPDTAQPLPNGGALGPNGVTLVPNGVTLAPILWARDDWLYVQQLGAYTQIPTRISRLHLPTGRLEPWQEVAPADPLGVNAITKVMLSRNTRTLVFNYRRVLSELFVAEPAATR
jgi:DNA-binding winged helix-turn-helix (wHTH) protein/WD40 repeat protein